MTDELSVDEQVAVEANPPEAPVPVAKESFLQEIKDELQHIETVSVEEIKKLLAWLASKI